MTELATELATESDLALATAWELDLVLGLAWGLALVKVWASYSELVMELVWRSASAWESERSHRD